MSEMPESQFVLERADVRSCWCYTVVGQVRADRLLTSVAPSTSWCLELEAERMKPVAAWRTSYLGVVVDLVRVGRMKISVDTCRSDPVRARVLRSVGRL